MSIIRKPSKVAWLVTWTGFAVGVTASVAANVAHARPEPGSQAVAAFAPLALFAVIETLIHVPGPRHWVPRWLRHLGIFVVANVAVLGSYRHMVGTALAAGEDTLAAYTLPASVDGLVLVTSLSLLALAERRREANSAGQAAALPPAAAVPTAAAVVQPVPAVPPAAAVVPLPRSPLEQAADVIDRADEEIAAYDAMTADLWASARAQYRASGGTLTGRELAERFGRSERWGRDRILETRAGDLWRESEQAGQPMDAQALGKAVAALGSSPRDARWGAARIVEARLDYTQAV